MTPIRCRKSVSRRSSGPAGWLWPVPASSPSGGGEPDIRSHVLDSVAGGWQVSSTYSIQLGGPLTWLNVSTNNPGDYVYLGGPLNSNPRNIDQAFDISSFDTRAATQFQYHVRTFSTTFSNVRADGINNWDISLQKLFSFAEKRSLQFRGEAFNFANHPVFAAPNTTATNSAFGPITARANRPGLVQLVARLAF